MLRFLFGFSGRAGRRAFWLVSIGLPVAIAAIAFMIAGGTGIVLEGGHFSAREASSVTFFLLLLLVLAATIVSLAVTVRRLHDLDRSAWWLAALFAANFVLSAVSSWTSAQSGAAAFSLPGLLSSLLSLVFFLWLGFGRGSRGPNRYGPDPRA